ncbi:MAG: HPP family protein [Halobacteriaceae archaeon]
MRRDDDRLRVAALAARLRRVERRELRELRELREWLETTTNLLHLSVLVFVPLLVGLVTWLSNELRVVSFLLFPPLASGTYTLFADPEGRHSDPVSFVAGMTLGALAGWVALAAFAEPVQGPSGLFRVHAGAAALAVALTAIVTWAADVEVPTAFSAALLVLLTNARLAYVVSIALSASIVAAAFVLWREEVYEERARFLYRTVQADDHVLVPMRGPTARETALFGARLAAAHEASKVVLLDIVDDEAAAAAEATALERASGPADGAVVEGDAEAADAAAWDGDDPAWDGQDAAWDGDDPAWGPDAVERAAERLEACAAEVESAVDVPCEVVVAAAGDDPAATTLAAATEAGCDLVVAPARTEADRLDPFVRTLFAGSLDVVALRSTTGATAWRRVQVPVRRAGVVAHAMLDYAARLAGEDGYVAVSTCIGEREDRRRAESMLATLVETVDARCETQVARASIEEFLARIRGQYDLVVLGASSERSRASRFLSPPTFERIEDVDADVAVVHTGR